MENGEFNGDPFFNEEPLRINDDSLQQMGQLDTAGVNIVGLNGASLSTNALVADRVFELHHGGCSNRLSWSRQGHIVSISSDGTSIDLHCLVFDRRARTWGLGAKRNHHVGLGELASLAWSPMATDLAVVDIKGRVSILRPIGSAANRLSEVRAGTLDEVQDQGQAIGLAWLSQERANSPKQVVQFTSKQINTGKWAHNLVKSNPMHPLYQRAVVVVDRKGTFSLIYERADGAFSKTSASLGSQKSFTHAAFSPTLEGRLLVAVHADDGTISAYHVSIDFNPIKQDLNTPPGLSVELAAGKLPLLSHPTIHNQLHDPDSQLLTHLGIIPTSEIEKTTHSPPTVFGVYANINRNLGPADNGFFTSGTIRRWSLQKVEQTLHPIFNELPSKGNRNPAGFTTSVQQLPEKEDQALVNATLLENDQGMSVTMIDGRIDLLSIEDLSSQAFAATNDITSSLVQSGFSFPIVANPSMVTLSSNICSAVSLSVDSVLSLTTANYHIPSMGNTEGLDPNSPNADAAAAVVVLSFARSCWTNCNLDDLLNMVLHTFPATMATPLIISLYQTLFREGEFMHEKLPGSEVEKVVQKPVLTKVFSFHYGVSFLSIKDAAPNTPMPLSAQWVWIVSNLRFVAQLLFICIKAVQNPASEPSAELVEMVCGNIKWLLDLLRYIVWTIFEVSDREANPRFFQGLGEGDIGDGSQGLVALLLNCHWSRQFFVHIVRALKLLCKLPEPRSNQQTEIIRTIMQWSQGKGLSLIAVEALLDPRWSGWADNEMAGDSARISARQVRMMATGVVEDAFQGTVKRMLAKLLNVKGGMRDKGAVDRLKMWSHRVDLGWVLLDDEWDGPKAKGVRRVFDVHKKKVIKQGRKEVGSAQSEGEMIKRCVRCGRHNEDVNGVGKEYPRQVAGLMMRCVCDGPWIVEPWEQTA